MLEENQSDTRLEHIEQTFVKEREAKWVLFAFYQWEEMTTSCVYKVIIKQQLETHDFC